MRKTDWRCADWSGEQQASSGFRREQTKARPPHCAGGKLPKPAFHAVDALTQRAFEAFGRVFHLHRQAILMGLRRTGLDHSAVFALRLLAENDGMSQRDLAEILHLSRPRITSLLQGLEKVGAVRRLADPNDQRVTRVYLTPEGRRQEEANRAAFEEYVNSTVGSLSDDDKCELARLLEALALRIEERLRGPEDEQARSAR